MFVNTGQSRHVELIKIWLGSQPGFKTYLPVDKAEDLVYRKVAKYIDIDDEKPTKENVNKSIDAFKEQKQEKTKVPKKTKKTTTKTRKTK